MAKYNFRLARDLKRLDSTGPRGISSCALALIARRRSKVRSTWDYLKRRCAELNLPVMRTKAGCFRVCVGGPWLLIYPEGTWYGSVTTERCERILQEHVVANKPVTEWIERTQPLCAKI